MKIPLISGNEVDTNKLNDKDAALHEAINQLYVTCENLNVAGFAKVSVSNGNSLGMLYLPNTSDEVRIKEYSKLVASLDDWLYKTSDGRLSITSTQEGEEFDENDGKGLE